ncbi:MAG TPA: pseudouridine synthase [Cytophagales bacterium]|nr:pseudouridine synthase [Cytophagales bacterium]
MTINDFIVRHLKISHEKAAAQIQLKKILVNGLPAKQRQLVNQSDCIAVDNKELQTPPAPIYIAYYKPKGVECTLNPDINDNLFSLLPFKEKLFPVGRLDKASEGLLLLTNDGKLYKSIAGADAKQEKEYVVKVAEKITDNFILQMAGGIKIMGKTTRPCKVSKIDDFTFRIILTQGLNRQIRRMCFKLRYQVNFLQRTRIMGIPLNDLQPGEFRKVSKKEITGIE